jgi:CheY-like chemotaxis protein
MPKCVLVVDDDRMNVALLKGTLLSNGFDVTTAGDGEEALAEIKKRAPDLILLDVQMPKMDGYAFIMKKISDPAIAEIPVIVLTAEKRTEPLFKRHGVKSYLLKPIDTNDLLAKIKAIFPA